MVEEVVWLVVQMESENTGRHKGRVTAMLQEERQHFHGSGGVGS